MLVRWTLLNNCKATVLLCCVEKKKENAAAFFPPFVIIFIPTLEFFYFGESLKYFGLCIDVYRLYCSVPTVRTSKASPYGYVIQSFNFCHDDISFFFLSFLPSLGVNYSSYTWSLLHSNVSPWIIKLNRWRTSLQRSSHAPDEMSSESNSSVPSKQAPLLRVVCAEQYVASVYFDLLDISHYL